MQPHILLMHECSLWLHCIHLIQDVYVGRVMAGHYWLDTLQTECADTWSYILILILYDSS